MHDVLYDQLAEVEDRLWWHDARRKLIRYILGKFTLPTNGVALDIGCGTGGSLSLLGEFAAKVIGFDRSPRAVDWARRKNPQFDVREGDANHLSSDFAPESFDLITLLNVLEHTWIPDEREILKQVFSLLKPHGVVLLTSAAFPGLARRHDRLAMSRRRHTIPVMQGFLRAVGFDHLQGTYFNMSSFPLAWLLARCDRNRPAAGKPACQSKPACRHSETPLRELSVPPRFVNHAMKLQMGIELFLTRTFGRLPFGVTLLCAATKPSVTDNGSDTTSHVQSKRRGIRVGDECELADQSDCVGQPAGVLV